MSNIKKQSNEQYLSEVITSQEVRGWIDDNLRVGIHTSVGSGKSFFINSIVSNVLFEGLERGLFISNRKTIVAQQEGGCSPTNDTRDTFQYKTTQWLVTQYKHGIKLPSVDLLVIDEYHQLIMDSGFNKDIHLIQNIINELNIPTIFISATPPNDIFGLDVIIDNKRLNKAVFKYQNVEVYHYKDELESKLNQIILNTSDKVLFYINDSKYIESIYLQYKDCSMVYGGVGNKVLAPYINSYKVEELINNSKFEDRILFTTKVIDSGVNIIDKDLKHIFVFSYNVEEVLQVVGRKRDNKDELNIYIKNYNPKEIGGYKSMVSYKLGIINQFKNNPLQTVRGLSGSNEEYLLNELFCIDDNLKTVINTTVEENLKKEYTLLSNITSNSYIKELESVGVYGEDMTYKSEWEDLNNYLKDLHESGFVFLDRASRTPIIETINYREDGKQKKSLSKLNYHLELINSNYRLKQFETSRATNGKVKKYKSAWRVESVNN